MSPNTCQLAASPRKSSLAGPGLRSAVAGCRANQIRSGCPPGPHDLQPPNISDPEGVERTFQESNRQSKLDDEHRHDCHRLNVDGNQSVPFCQLVMLKAAADSHAWSQPKQGRAIQDIAYAMPICS